MHKVREQHKLRPAAESGAHSCLPRYPGTRGVARNLIWVGINGSRRQNNHKKFKVD